MDATTVRTRPERVAIVGSGIAGLTACYLLSEAGFEVEIFEREAEIGMDAHGVSGLMASDPDCRVDVPLRVFSRTYYPNLVAMYSRLGLKIIDADYSFSCSRFNRGDDGDGDDESGARTATTTTATKPKGEKGGGREDEGDAPLFGYNRYGWLPMPQIGAYFSTGRQLSSTSACASWRDTNLGLLLQLVRLLLRARAYVSCGGGVSGQAMSEVDLETFLLGKGYSKSFMRELFFPMLSVVCTCSYESVARYPAGVALDYFAKHGVLNLPWRKTCQCRVQGGVRAVAKLLSSKAHKVWLSSDVQSIDHGEHHHHGEEEEEENEEESGGGVEARKAQQQRSGTRRQPVVTHTVRGCVQRSEFDHVVVATQAHHAKALLNQDRMPIGLGEALGSFKYERSRVVVHSDPRLMPQPASSSASSSPLSSSPSSSRWCRRRWSPLNILVSPKSSMPMCSVWMHKIDPRVDADIYQTWNPLLEPEKSGVRADASFERPVVTVHSAKGMNALQRCQGVGGVWFVGAYALLSVPLLENGVTAAIQVSQSIGAPCSWHKTQKEEGPAAAAQSCFRQSLVLAASVATAGAAIAVVLGKRNSR